MKRIILISIPLLLTIFIACQKEYSFEPGINAPGLAEGTLRDSLGDCEPVEVKGLYMENVQLTDSNYVTIQVNVTTAGQYRISTDTLNGYWFIDEGYFPNVGLYTVRLKGGGKPILPIISNFEVTFGNSFCGFTVQVQPNSTSNSPNAADTAWMFDEGTAHYQGHVDSAKFRVVGSFQYLTIKGNPITNDTTIFIEFLAGSQGTPPSGTYSTSLGSAVFEFKNQQGDIIYESRQGDGSDLIFTITSFDPGTKIMKATFSGTVNDANDVIKNITLGKLNVQVE